MKRFLLLLTISLLAAPTMGCAGARPAGVLYGQSNRAFAGRTALTKQAAFEFNCNGPLELHVLAWAELFNHAVHQVGVRGCGKQAVYEHIAGMFIGNLHAWETQRIDTIDSNAHISPAAAAPPPVQR